MSFKQISKLCISLVFSLAASASFASTIVWDYSPLATGGSVTNDYWTNQLAGQHFAENVLFASATQIVGMDIYNAIDVGGMSPVQVTVWSNSGSTPGAILATFLTSVSAIDSNGAKAGEHRLHADISGFTMLANTSYWIGMAPTAGSWTQTGLNGVAGGNGNMAQFNGASFSHLATIGDMAFRLYGADAAVPEPASMALFGLALLGLGAARRRSSN